MLSIAMAKEPDNQIFALTQKIGPSEKKSVKSTTLAHPLPDGECRLLPAPFQERAQRSRISQIEQIYIFQAAAAKDLLHTFPGLANLTNLSMKGTQNYSTQKGNAAAF